MRPAVVLVFGLFKPPNVLELHRFCGRVETKPRAMIYGVAG